MKVNRRLQPLFILLLLMFAPAAGAQETSESQPPKYSMELLWIADSPDGVREYLFVIGRVGFRTIEGLKDFVSRFPAGSILEWAPGCVRMGDEPLLSDEEEMAGFRKFCEEHGVEFVLVPSG